MRISRAFSHEEYGLTTNLLQLSRLMKKCIHSCGKHLGKLRSLQARAARVAARICGSSSVRGPRAPPDKENHEVSKRQHNRNKRVPVATPAQAGWARYLLCELQRLRLRYVARGVDAFWQHSLQFFFPRAGLWPTIDRAIQSRAS
jgi:hypothetical protein